MQSNAEDILSRLAGIITEIRELHEGRNHSKESDYFTEDVLQAFDQELPEPFPSLSRDHACKAAVSLACWMYGREVEDDTALSSFMLGSVFASYAPGRPGISEFLMLCGIAARRVKKGEDIEPSHH